MSLGKRIREQRKMVGMSQEKLAELAGVSRQAVTKWETDLSSPSTANLFALAEILGTRVDVLMDKESNESIRSSAEQTYYLYKLEEEKKVMDLRRKRKKNLRIALISLLCHLVLLVFCSLLTGGLGRQITSMSWLIHYYPLLIVAALSIVSVLMGKHRLSLVIALANLAGIFLGILLGYGYTGPDYSMSYYGWAVWGGTVLVSMVPGTIWEKSVLQKDKPNRKKSWLLSGIALTVAVLIAAVVITSVPKYAQPSYEVISYEALLLEFSNEPKYLLPPIEYLPSETTSCMVNLKSRFSNKKSGYHISLKPKAGIFKSCSITSQLLVTHPDKVSNVQSNLEYKGTAIQTSEYEVKFLFGQCQYLIQFEPLSDQCTQDALSLAKAMIDLG